jgi:sulfur carrier protein ThiS
MIEEKLHLYAEFSFAAEATLAFEAKLSGFLGRDVVLAEERAMSTADALEILRAVAGWFKLTDAQIARYGISGEPAAADAVRILRVVAGII